MLFAQSDRQLQPVPFLSLNVLVHPKLLSFSFGWPSSASSKTTPLLSAQVTFYAVISTPLFQSKVSFLQYAFSISFPYLFSPFHRKQRSDLDKKQPLMISTSIVL